MRALLAPAAIAVSLLMTNPAGAAAPGQGGGIDFRAGVFLPSADSDFWEAEGRRFHAGSQRHGRFHRQASDTSPPINNYVEFDIDASFYAAEELSSDRDFTDTFGNDIFHDTRLFTSPVTVSVRVLPAGRYARRGAEGRHYVRRPASYLGAGVGLTYWRFEEEGDFVFDSPTLGIRGRLRPHAGRRRRIRNPRQGGDRVPDLTRLEPHARGASVLGGSDAR